ncbi:MAG: hypothetical protein FWC47_17185 [Oscillospiraceae bacterium]|nr:hypothetical protein [Oscillospiraceae bacterium]
MKKKTLFSALAIVLVAALMFIPAVQTLAISALSVFRVGNTKTITVSLTDIEDAVNYLKQFQGQFSEKDVNSNLAAQNIDKNTAIEDAKSQVKTLSDVSEFTAFSFNLPTALKNETPELYATDATSKTITVDTTMINDELAKIGVSNLIDNSYNGSEVTVNVAPSIAAHYTDVDLFATQGAYLDGNNAVINGLWSNFLQMPFISDNLRSQLSNIDVMKEDVYLPVIMGLGRETSIGNTTGYIYTTQDMQQVLSSLPQDMMPNDGNSTQSPKEGSALIWTKNGVLYCLVANKSDSELTQIARSIK